MSTSLARHCTVLPLPYLAYLISFSFRSLIRNKVLANYFDGTLGTEEQLIPPQPLRYSETKFNNHKISSLPYHQAFVDPTLFHSSLYNLEFIEAKIRAGMLAELIRDYEFAISLLQVIFALVLAPKMCSNFFYYRKILTFNKSLEITLKN
jgi:hypothetical protein